MQKVVNAAPTASEGDRVHRMISAMVNVGIDGGYLLSPRLARVHWQAGDRPLPAPRVSVAGESVQWVDPSEIPSGADVDRRGKALAAGHDDMEELMAQLAAYSGLRRGEETALMISQVDQGGRTIAVSRKIVDIAGTLLVETPKGRKKRHAIYPRCTPGGYPLAGKLGARIEEARAEQEAGSNPLGLIFPSRGRVTAERQPMRCPNSHAAGYVGFCPSGRAGQAGLPELAPTETNSLTRSLRSSSKLRGSPVQ